MSITESVKILQVLETLRNACHQNSKDKGFWDEDMRIVTRADAVKGGARQEMVYVPMKPWNFGEKVALVHSELSEMFEAWRKNLGDSEKDIFVIDPRCRTEADPLSHRRITAIEEELADCFIRLFDLAGKLDIDVGRVILAKMEYNAGREHMHGGRKC